MHDHAIHVLLVEDNPGDVKFIRRLLAEASTMQSDSQAFDLTCVDTLAEGVDSLHALQSDVVLLDLSLPDSQGLSTLTRMQAAAPSVPVVVLTGLADQNAALAAVQNGAQDYLVKGRVDPYALSNSIRYARERKQLLEELRLHSASLEERNADLDAFAHTVAHDLKNHVFSVMGNVEMLLELEGEIESEAEFTAQRSQWREMLTTVLRSGYKMAQIVEELLLLGQVRRVEVERTPMDMAEVIDEVQVRLAPLLAESGGELFTGDPLLWPVALGYAPWIEEVWYNYISNALKYGGSPPRVELGAERQGKQRVCFWVRDNGPGLTAAQMERLFGEFTRLHSGSSGSSHGLGQSHGLGLSIVKRIIDKLGGEVSVQSQLGVGSTFRFTLPAANPSRR